MKKYFLPLLLVLTLAGCALFRNPDKAWTKATAKVEAVQAKIDANKDDTIEKGRNYVYGVKLALDADPSTNRSYQVAYLLNGKAIEVLGTPKMEDANALRAMVANLMATNRLVIERGQRQLAAMDEQVITLQKQNEQLVERLDKANDKLIAVGTENAGYASKWTTIVKFVWYAIYFVIAAFVFKILAVVVPPPYNSIFGIVDFVLGGIVRFVFKLAPKAMETAKVVTQDYKTGLEHVVTSIEDAKTKIDAKNAPDGTQSAGLTQLKTELKTNTDAITKTLINRTKEELGYI